MCNLSHTALSMCNTRAPLVSRRRAAGNQLRDPFAQSRDVLGVVVGTGLADPPGSLVVLLPECEPGLEHPGSTAVRLEPGDAPRLARHGFQEDRVEGIDV